MQFFTRMLFSALVDADFIETECFYDRCENRASQRGCHGTLQDHQSRLNAHLSGFGKPEGKFNNARARILNH